MIPQVLKYPFDPKGESTLNLVVDEPHQIGMTGNRCIVPREGPFFSHSVQLRDLATNTVLTRGTHYQARFLHQKATEASGQEVCVAVEIFDGISVSDLLLTYQVVGGDFFNTTAELEQYLSAISMDHRPMWWNNIRDKPDTFRPAGHYHPIGDMVGWEDIIVALNGIRNALINNDRLRLTLYYQSVDQQLASIDTSEYTQWERTGNDVRGALREVKTGFTIQWGESAYLNPGEHQVVPYTATWNGGRPYRVTVEAEAVHTGNTQEQGSNPYIGVWLADQGNAATECVMALMRITKVPPYTAKLNYVAYGNTGTPKVHLFA